MKSRRWTLTRAAAHVAVAGGLLCSSGIAHATVGDSTEAEPASLVGRGSPPVRQFTKGQIVLQLNPASRARIQDINRDYGTQSIRGFFQGSATHLLRTKNGRDPLLTVRDMLADRRIAYVEPNFVGTLPEAQPFIKYIWGIGEWPDLFSLDLIGLLILEDPPDDDALDSSWLVAEAIPGDGGVFGLALPDGSDHDVFAPLQASITSAHQLTKGSGVVVAILDTGVQTTHPALAGAIKSSGAYDVVSGDMSPAEDFNGLDEDGDGTVDEAAGHGTFVAGIVRMMAPQAKILPIRVMNSDGLGTTFDIAEGIVRAVAAGADVINLSVSAAEPSILLQEAVRFANASGAVVVAAAGNWGGSSAGFPAANPCVLGVSAVDTTKARAEFANYGPGVDLAAPGVNVFSTFPNPATPSQSTYVYWAGTSVAAPFISGHAALLMSLRSDLDPAEVAAYITVGSRQVSSPAGNLGAGLPHVLTSVKAAAARSPLPASLLERECTGGRLGRLLP